MRDFTTLPKTVISLLKTLGSNELQKLRREVGIGKETHIIPNLPEKHRESLKKILQILENFEYQKGTTKKIDISNNPIEIQEPIMKSNTSLNRVIIGFDETLGHFVQFTSSNFDRDLILSLGHNRETETTRMSIVFCYHPGLSDNYLLDTTVNIGPKETRVTTDRESDLGIDETLNRTFDMFNQVSNRIQENTR